MTGSTSLKSLDPRAIPHAAHSTHANHSIARRDRLKPENPMIEVKGLTIGWHNIIVQKDLNFTVKCGVQVSHRPSSCQHTPQRHAAADIKCFYAQ